MIVSPAESVRLPSDLRESTGWAKPPTACFFAAVRDRSVLETTEFYAQDLAILRALGYDVQVATRWTEVPLGCDLYVVWWWTRATFPLLLARLRGRPSMVTGAFNDVPFPARTWLQQRVIQLNYRLAGANVAVSRNDHDFLHARFPGGRLAYVPHSVDTDVYTPGTAPREDFCLTVCWMRRPNAVRKCMFELIEAVPRILAERPELRFRIAGDPEDGGPELRRRAERLGVADALEFLGRVSPVEKIRLMQTCQLYLQPTRYEGFGLAIAEAMACGAPVVTSPVGAVPEVVGPLGEFVDGNDPASIARGVVSLSRQPELRRLRSEEGRRRIEANFSTARRRDGLLDVIRGLTTRSNSMPKGNGLPHAHPR